MEAATGKPRWALRAGVFAAGIALLYGLDLAAQAGLIEYVQRIILLAGINVILAVGLNPSRSLVISQVVLSFGIPFALIPLLIHCRNRQVMGALVNRRATTAIATVVVALIVSLNVFLLYQTFFGS